VITKNDHGAHKVVWTADHCGPRGSANGGSSRKPYVCGRRSCINSTHGSIRTYDICATERTGGRCLPAASRCCGAIARVPKSITGMLRGSRNLFGAHHYPVPLSLFLDIACRTDGLSIRAPFIPEIGGLVPNPLSCGVAVLKWPSGLPMVPAVPITRVRRSKLLGSNRLRHKHCDNALCRLFECAAASH
jgi:hypothetical protein